MTCKISSKEILFSFFMSDELGDSQLPEKRERRARSLIDSRFSYRAQNAKRFLSFYSEPVFQERRAQSAPKLIVVSRARYVALWK